MTTCPCGSGLEPTAELDGYDIYLFLGCPTCREQKLAKFRPDIFTRYQTDEQIEDDY